MNEYEGDDGGILNSSGLRDYEDIQTSVVPGGVSVILNCRFCNRKKQVIIEWQELVGLAANQANQVPVLPKGWKYSNKNQDAYIPLRCDSCGNENGIAVHMSPEEAGQHVAAGQRAGLVDPRYVQQVHSQIRAMRGG